MLGSLILLTALAVSDLTGTWTISTRNANDEAIQAEMKIEDAKPMKVSIPIDANEIQVKSATHDGDAVVLVFPFMDNEITVKLTEQSGALEGAWSTPDGAGAPVKAVRKK